MEYIYEHLEGIPVKIEYPEGFETIIDESLQKSIIYNRFKKNSALPVLRRNI